MGNGSMKGEAKCEPDAIEHDKPEEEEKGEEGSHEDFIEEDGEPALSQDGEGEERVVVSEKGEEKQRSPLLLDGPFRPAEATQEDGESDDEDDGDHEECEAPPQLKQGVPCRDVAECEAHVTHPSLRRRVDHADLCVVCLRKQVEEKKEEQRGEIP